MGLSGSRSVASITRVIVSVSIALLTRCEIATASLAVARDTAPLCRAARTNSFSSPFLSATIIRPALNRAVVLASPSPGSSTAIAGSAASMGGKYRVSSASWSSIFGSPVLWNCSTTRTPSSPIHSGRLGLSPPAAHRISSEEIDSPGFSFSHRSITGEPSSAYRDIPAIAATADRYSPHPFSVFDPRPPVIDTISSTRSRR